MIQSLCTPKELFIIIIVLLAALLVVGAGGGLGKFIRPLLKKMFGKGEVNINFSGGEMAEKYSGAVCLVDPTKCPDHKAEHERSVENKNNIGKIFTSISALKKEVSDGNERILLALVAGGHIRPEHIPPKK